MAIDEYEHILRVLQNMVGVMEPSPTAFAHMKEEHLRDHFLVQLNAQYEGGATGETFNFEGKTDILVRVDGRTVFIAECKFWDGPKVIARTIDQLLDYASWRDTKTAILIFNRGRGCLPCFRKSRRPFSAIRAASAKSPIAARRRSGSSFVTGDDPDRELTLNRPRFRGSRLRRLGWGDSPTDAPREIPRRVDPGLEFVESEALRALCLAA